MHAAAAVKRAVLAPEVLERGALRSDDQPRMTTRDRRTIELDVDVGIAADDVLAIRQREAALAPLEPAGWRLRAWSARPRRDRRECRLGAKGVTKSMHGSDELRR